jgi:hypothetical protein
MERCEYCNGKHIGEYGSGRFCSSKCSRGFSTKYKRKEINIKISEKLKGQIPINRGKYLIDRIISKCSNNLCNVNIEKRIDDNEPRFCSKSCSSSYTSKIRCNSISEKDRMREIGRKGGFGKKGITKGGIPYQSSLEMECFEYLENNQIDFIAHPKIPGTSKVSDLYINKYNLWIEIDGINREFRKKWLGKNYDYWIEKLEIYKKINLNFKIVYSLEDLKRIL